MEPPLAPHETHYRESQVRIDEADAALRDGDEERARTLYREAALLQHAFVESLPSDRVRTKSIYGLSVATLLYRAGDLEDVEQLAHQLLAEPWIEADCAAKLRMLLNQTRVKFREQPTVLEPRAPGAVSKPAEERPQGRGGRKGAGKSPVF